ncbi:anthranilate synthase, aminase component [hydrocarbon metagenome]|uniref:Anthranilate synthase, aminase component n=1 Tax=hydrocarbon metagenome TaxID=938273 RepID=A0A0W8E2X6_9ZZZZ
MSRYEQNAGTFERAGFYLPFSGAQVFPEPETFIAMGKIYDYVPMYARIKLDHFDMVKYFDCRNTGELCCLLESLTGSDNGRYSILACNPLHEAFSGLNDPQGVSLMHNFISSLRTPRPGFPFFTGGLIGYWSYEAGLFYQGLEVDPGPGAEQFFFMPGEILVYDRHTSVLSVFVWLAGAEADETSYERASLRMDDILIEASEHVNHKTMQQGAGYDMNALGIDEEYQVNIDRDGYCHMVIQAKEYIRQGDIFQVVLSRRWVKESTANPWQVYIKLRDLNPSPYMFYLQLPDSVLMGASPEMQVKVHGGRLKNRPIAGTRKVTGIEERDKVLLEELLQDEKERAEHLMLVDLSRNDVGSVCKAGSVHLNEFMQPEKYSHVMHLVSTVEGQLKENISPLEAFQACFPAGTLSGAPKRKAMEIIQTLEQDPRGPYGGAVGYLSFDGSLESCITIRAILYKTGKYYLQSGAGIVADSDPEQEHKETLNKARALMLAVKGAEAVK